MTPSTNRSSSFRSLVRFHFTIGDDVWTGLGLPTAAQTAATNLDALELVALARLAAQVGDGVALEVLGAEVARRAGGAS